MIYLIGVDHQVQHDGPTLISEREKAIAEFSIFLKSKAKALNITMLAEELNEDSLKGSRASESTVREIAKQLGLKHLFCDPTRAQRKELGINKDIDLRENYWLSGLEDYRTEKNILFVCGAGHLETFGQKLIKAGYQVDILPEKFGIGLPTPIIFSSSAVMIDELER
jgi:hypothetical protein